MTNSDSTMRKEKEPKNTATIGNSALLTTYDTKCTLKSSRYQNLKKNTVEKKKNISKICTGFRINTFKKDL